MRSLEANKKPVSTSTIVVASKPLRFGNELIAAQSARSRVAGGCAAGRRLRQDRRRAEGRQARRAHRDRAERAGAEPSRSPAPGQRATLSAMLHDGMKAVTVRVNDVEGVGGFVLPGDRVDVALTRQVDKSQRIDRGRAAERPRAGGRSDRRRARRQAGGGQGGHARGRHGRRAEAVARGLGRQPVADAAQGRRGQQPIHAARITLERSRQRRSTPTATIDGPIERRHRRRAARGDTQEYSVPIEGTDMLAASSADRGGHGTSSGTARDRGIGETDGWGA